MALFQTPGWVSKADTLLKIKTILIIAAFCMTLSGCGNSNEKTYNKDIAAYPSTAMVGDVLYIADGYKDKLTEMGMTEVVAKPYFQSPFITIAKDKSGKQYAVLFYKEGKVDKRELPVTYEEIINIFEHKSYPVIKKINTENVNIFEIHGKLFWCFSEEKTVYLNVFGKEEVPFN